MLKLNNITKKFGEKTVLNGINLEINDGDIYGLVGANGAGKTTLMNIVSQILAPNSGSVEIDGKKLKSLNDLSGKIGYMLDIPPMHDFLTAREYFEFLSAAQKFSKVELVAKTNELLAQVGLSDVADKRIKNFSRGMRQRLGIAAGLITNPRIILMDEPSSALDPVGRAEVIEIIKRLANNGKTIILSTHILADVEKVCNRVGLLSFGNLVIEGTLNDVLKSFQDNVFQVDCDEELVEKVIAAAKKNKFFDRAQTVSSGVDVYFKQDGKKSMFSSLVKVSDEINGVYLKPTTIEEIFLKASKKVGA